MLWRQGDVMIASIEHLPIGGQRLKGSVLVEGEMTGHTHRIVDPSSAELWEIGGVLHMKVLADTTYIVHDEHNSLELPKGVYRIWQQREYTPQQVRRVRD